MLKSLSKGSALEVALAVSLALHVVLLSVHFVSKPPRRLHDSGLDVILVNANRPSKTSPHAPQALAQVDRDGGGNTDEDRRFASPLEPSLQQQTGEFAERKLQREQQQKTADKRSQLLAQNSNTRPLPDKDKQDKKDSPSKTSEGTDLVESARAMARDMSLEERIDTFNKRPRRSTFGLRVKHVPTARYIEEWRQKVQRIGTLNYPPAAKGRLYGSLTVTVTIDRNGNVIELVIDRSSGIKLLDDAALNIIRMGAPYPPLSKEILKQMDELAFVRTISFTNRNRDDAFSAF